MRALGDWTALSCIGFLLLFARCDGLFFNQLDNSDDYYDENESKVRLIFYDGSSSTSKSYDWSIVESKELLKYIDPYKPSVFYFHGYEEHPANESCQTIISAYLERGSDNLLLLDWSALAFDNYLVTYLRVKDIAKYTAKALKHLVAEGLNAETIHLIGHSMGAQVAGLVWQYLDFTLPRVTGLDPANPLFYQFGSAHISERSGRQVDVIHTDGGMYGAYEVSGTLDFFPNGGVRPQPGCKLFGLPLSPRGLCSHWRSWRFYAESVVNNTAFPARQCDSYGSFLLGHCDDNERVVYMGYAVPKDASGKFYLTTNDAPSYGRGIGGIET